MLWLEHLTWMRIFLMIGLGLAAWALWSLHVNQGDHKDCDLFDILKEHGKLSRLAVTYIFMVGLTSWIMIDLQMDEKMTPAYFATYCSVLVAPIIAKMFAAPLSPVTTDQKKEPPG